MNQELLRLASLFSQRQHLDLHHAAFMIDVPKGNAGQDAIEAVVAGLTHPHCPRCELRHGMIGSGRGLSMFYGSAAPEAMIIFNELADVAMGIIPDLPVWQGKALGHPLRYWRSYRLCHIIHAASEDGRLPLLRPRIRRLHVIPYEECPTSAAVMADDTGYQVRVDGKEAVDVLVEAARNFKANVFATMPSTINAFMGAAMLLEMLARDVKPEESLTQEEFAALSGWSSSKVSRMIGKGLEHPLTPAKARQIRTAAKTKRRGTDQGDEEQTWLCAKCDDAFALTAKEAVKGCPTCGKKLVAED